MTTPNKYGTAKRARTIDYGTPKRNADQMERARVGFLVNNRLSDWLT